MSRTARCHLWLLLLVCAWIFAASFPAFAQVDILSGKSLVPPGGDIAIEGPESVVTVSAEVTAPAGRPATLSGTAEISPPWYAYAIPQKPVLATPTKITVDAGDDYRLAGDF